MTSAARTKPRRSAAPAGDAAASQDEVGLFPIDQSMLPPPDPAREALLAKRRMVNDLINTYWHPPSDQVKIQKRPAVFAALMSVFKDDSLDPARVGDAITQCVKDGYPISTGSIQVALTRRSRQRSSDFSAARAAGASLETWIEGATADEQAWARANAAANEAINDAVTAWLFHPDQASQPKPPPAKRPDEDWVAYEERTGHRVPACMEPFMDRAQHPAPSDGSGEVGA